MLKFGDRIIVPVRSVHTLSLLSVPFRSPFRFPTIDMHLDLSSIHGSPFDHAWPRVCFSAVSPSFPP
jgi:hypothetical protein